MNKILKHIEEVSGRKRAQANKAMLFSHQICAACGLDAAPKQLSYPFDGWILETKRCYLESIGWVNLFEVTKKGKAGSSGTREINLLSNKEESQFLSDLTKHLND